MTKHGVSITALVDASGFGGCRDRDGPWRSVCHFAAWRMNGGEVRRGKLRFEQDVPERLMKERMDAIPAYSLVRVLAASEPQRLSNTGLECVIASELIENARDEDLAAEGRRLQEPVVHEDPVLGVLELDRRVEWFTGSVEWLGSPAAISLAAGSLDALPSVIRHALEIVNQQSTLDVQLRHRVAESMLDIFNDWLDEDSVTMTEEQFMQRLEVRSLCVDRDGSYSIEVECEGEAFGDHAIEVRGHVARGLLSAELM